MKKIKTFFSKILIPVCTQKAKRVKVELPNASET